jgi:hypothetical protein
MIDSSGGLDRQPRKASRRRRCDRVQEKNRMGLEQTVTFARGTLPPWNEISDLLARRGFPVQVRMIDNELAFADELPPETWRELRLGTPQGMVTLRREDRQVVVVAWGNADSGLLRAWNGVSWALAEATGGCIQSPSGSLNAADFLRTADLPSGIKGTS